MAKGMRRCRSSVPRPVALSGAALLFGSSGGLSSSTTRHTDGMIKTRDATIIDAPSVTSLLRFLGHESGVGSVEQEIALAVSEGRGVLLAVEGDQALGFAAFDIWRAFVEQVWVCRLSAVAVRPQDRGRGTARHLLLEVERRAEAFGCTAMELSCGRRAERAAAHALYASLGYSDACAHHATYRKDLRPQAGASPQ